MPDLPFDVAAQAWIAVGVGAALLVGGACRLDLPAGRGATAALAAPLGVLAVTLTDGADRLDRLDPAPDHAAWPLALAVALSLVMLAALGGKRPRHARLITGDR